MSLIHQAYIDSLRSIPQKRRERVLFPSEFGMHPVNIMERLNFGGEKSFTDPVLDKMQAGVALEEDTMKFVSRSLGACTLQFPLYNQFWSGHADMVIGHKQCFAERRDENAFPITPIIVEHKATDPRYWDEGKLIKSNHVAQLWLYGELYREMYGIKPRLILYYRSWGRYAEAEIVGGNQQILITGEKDGRSFNTLLQVNLPFLRAEIEHWFYMAEFPPTGTIPIESFEYATMRSKEVEEGIGVLPEILARVRRHSENFGGGA